MSGNQSEWITLSDFSPGIYGDMHASGATPGDSTKGALLRDGAATLADTYGCIADRYGALIPLPKRTVGLSQTLPPAGNANGTSTYYPANMIGAYLLDAIVIGPTGIPTTSFIVACLWGFAYSTGGGGANYSRMLLGREYRGDTGAIVRDFYWESAYPITFSTASYPLPASNLFSFYSTNAATLPVPFDTLVRTTGIVTTLWQSHGIVAVRAAEVPLTTYDTDVSANYCAAGSIEGYMAFSPNPATGASILRVTQTTGAGPSNVFEVVTNGLVHQGRAVALRRQGYAMPGGYSLNSQQLAYTPPGDGRSAGSQDHGVVQLDRGEAQGFGAMASVTSDELLLVGHGGGAKLIRGDVANPTIVNLPFVAPTLGVSAQCCNSPIGVVYGARNGVYAWSGGDTSKLLSTQIDGWFWRYGTSTERSNMVSFGRFCSWQNKVLLPNNWMYDTEASAWWRLADPTANNSTPYNVYAVDVATGNLLAFPYKLTGSQNVVYDVYDPTVLGGAYSWRSQPLLSSRERAFNAQVVELVAVDSSTSGSTVAVVVEGVLEDGTLASRTVNFTLTGSATSGGRPQIIRQVLPSPDGGTTAGAITARYIQIKLTATATGAGEPAPKIISVGLGLSDRRSVKQD